MSIEVRRTAMAAPPLGVSVGALNAKMAAPFRVKTVVVYGTDMLMDPNGAALMEAGPASTARLALGLRKRGHQLSCDTCGNGLHDPDPRPQGVREQNWKRVFRKAASRTSAGERPGDSDRDRDGGGDGLVNGADGNILTVTLLVNADRATDKTVAEAVVAVMADVGVKVTLSRLTGKDSDPACEPGGWGRIMRRNDQEWFSAFQTTNMLASAGPKTLARHRTGTGRTSDPQPCDQALADEITAFTKKVTAVRRTPCQGALPNIKRFANIPAEGLSYRFSRAEDTLIRCQVFVPGDKQLGAGRQPQTLPGAPGAPGPVAANRRFLPPNCGGKRPSPPETAILFSNLAGDHDSGLSSRPADAIAAGPDRDATKAPSTPGWTTPHPTSPAVL
jgi:hypothetical protein